MSCPTGRHLRAFLTLLALGAPWAAAAQAPEPVTVRVRQVAGDNLYLDIGSSHGLATGDTIPVLRDAGGERLGLVVVVATSEERSVLGFVGDPIPLEAGSPLTLALLRAPVAAVPPEARPSEPIAARLPRESPSAPTSQESGRASSYGRIAAEVTAMHSSTRVGGSDPIQVDRTFATPSIRVDWTVPDALAGFRLTTSTRFDYRYSDGPAIQPTGSLRIYTASLERTFTAIPLRVGLGRFRSPVETYSGYTDGLFLRLGGVGLGAGVILGLEPDRGNEGLSTERPKASVFVDAERRGSDWWWRADLSGHLVRGGEVERDRRFVGISQRVGWRAVGLTQDLQVDQGNAGEGPTISHIRLQGTLDLPRGWQALMGYTMRRRYAPELGEAFSGAQTERILVGMSYRGDGSGAGLNVSRTAERTQSPAVGYQAYVDLRKLPGIPLSALVSASFWDGDLGNALSLTPTVSASRGNGRYSLGYRLYRSDYLSRQTTQHGAELTADFPIGAEVRASLQLRADLSADLRSEQLRLQLYRRF